MKAVFRKLTFEQTVPNISKELVFDEFKIPKVLNEHDVVVGVSACGISQVSGVVLSELFKKKSYVRCPAGWEIAGIVRCVGSQVRSVKPGDKVAGVLPLDSESTGLCEVAVVEEYHIVKILDGVDLKQVAGIIGDGLKAYTALHTQAHLSAGDTVLVIDAGSSCGYLICQLAALWGAKVIATAKNADEKTILEKLQPPIDYVFDLGDKSNLMVGSVLDQTGGLGVDIVIDTTVPKYYPNDAGMKKKQTQQQSSIHEIISCLAGGGRWVTTRENLQLDPPNSRQLFMKGCSISFLFEHVWTLMSSKSGVYTHILHDVINMLQSGKLTPLLAKTVTLDGVADWLDRFTEQPGKTVVSMTSEMEK